MSFIKVESMSGCGLAELLGLPSGDLVNQRADLCPHLTLFPASSQICPLAEVQTFDPVCFCNLYFFQSVCYIMVFFVSCYRAFLSQCQSQTPTRKNHLVRAIIIQ